MKKIKYLGPADVINVGLGGLDVQPHAKGKVLEYEEDIAKDLLKDKKNNFEAVEKAEKPKTNGKK